MSAAEQTQDVPQWVLIRHPRTAAKDWKRLPSGGWVHRTATVGDGARVGDYATVGDYARVGDGARVGNDATFDRSPLLIQGNKHAVYHSGPDSIGVGCTIKPLVWWREHGKQFARHNGYTDAEIAEYEPYFDLMERRDAVVFPKVEPATEVTPKEKRGKKGSGARPSKPKPKTKAKPAAKTTTTGSKPARRSTKAK